MKSLIAIVATAFLVLTVVDVAALVVVGYIGGNYIPARQYSELLLFLYAALIALTVIFAVISAVVSPQVPLTRVVFCGLTALFGLFGLLKAPQFLVGPLPRDYVSYSLALFMAGIAIPSVLTIAWVRNNALLYCAYGLIVALCLINFRLDYQIVMRGILSG
ncbi:MAG TPA: hypothetical protein VGJ20_07195 [Xanthobacteraceae bacterium]|jgi:hypothetical protein